MGGGVGDEEMSRDKLQNERAMHAVRWRQMSEVITQFRKKMCL